MHPRTFATLDQLRTVDWFRCVGVYNIDVDVDGAEVEILSSWYEAVESCSSPEWEDLLLEASNQYCERLFERSPERFQKWNELVVEVKPAAIALVREKTKKVIEENDLPKRFVDVVEWDIVGLCMEAEYADVYPPGFYSSQGYCYMKGHFPCGWRGEFPKGKLIIY